MYKVQIDELVFAEDFKKIDRPNQQRIIRAVRDKLSTEPKAYGKPLAGDLKGFWRLRVGQYRVIYQVLESEVTVYVIKVGYRRDMEVYEQLASRLKL
jgi:mRNA interferase RelE/StbE